MTDAPGFNAWHTDVAKSPACALIVQRALGLPPQVVSNSLLTGDGIAEVEAALQVAPGQILVDLACGRGGYGREVTRRTGARLAGLDSLRRGGHDRRSRRAPRPGPVLRGRLHRPGAPGSSR